jgi:hypothetical protein
MVNCRLSQSSLPYSFWHHVLFDKTWDELDVVHAPCRVTVLWLSLLKTSCALE